MKITRSALKNLIKEEMNRINETPPYVGDGTTGALVAKRQPGRYITRDDFDRFVKQFLPGSRFECDAIVELTKKQVMHSSKAQRPEDQIPPMRGLEAEIRTQQNIFKEEAAQVEWIEELFFGEADPCEERAWPLGQDRARQEWESLVKTS